MIKTIKLMKKKKKKKAKMNLKWQMKKRSQLLEYIKG